METEFFDSRTTFKGNLSNFTGVGSSWSMNKQCIQCVYTIYRLRLPSIHEIFLALCYAEFCYNIVSDHDGHAYTQ